MTSHEQKNIKKNLKELISIEKSKAKKEKLFGNLANFQAEINEMYEAGFSAKKQIEILKDTYICQEFV